MLDLIISTLTQGFIYAMLSYGIYITYKILDFPDLTVDGSFPLGAAVTALLLVKGVNPYLTLLAALASGAAAGFVMGLAVIWLAFAVLTIFGSSTLSKSVFEAVNDSAVLTFIYDKNFIMKYVSIIMR